MPKKPVLNKAPLTDACFAPLPLKAVKPQGPFLTRLKEAARWAGQLAWEDDYLYGFASLALLTEDQALVKQVQARVEAILAAQREDGAVAEDADLAAQGALLRGLIAWYAATSDKRVLLYMLKRLQFIYRHADAMFESLKDAALTGDFVYAAVVLYGWTGSAFLLKLVEKLRALGLDWAGFFVSFPVVRPFQKHIPPEEMKRGLASQDKQTRIYYEKQQIMADGLNIARGLKTPAVLSRFSGSSREKEAGKAGLEKVMRYHGTAHGLFAAEPSLMGGDPSCGMDGRAVPEAIFSLEQLLVTLGHGSFADAMEKIALNILPAMEKNGLVRPMQRVNGPFPKDGAPAAEAGPWVDAWLRGMAGYAAGLWMAAPGEGLALVGYVPSLLRWKVKGINVAIQVEGKYPMEGEVAVTIHAKEPVAFPLQLRIPSWAHGAWVQVNEEGAQDPAPGSFFVLDRVWREGDRITLSLPMSPRITRWQHQSAAVEYGPLLMALPLDGEQPVWQLALLEHGAMEAGLVKTPEGEQLQVTAVFKAAPGWELKGGKPQMPPIRPDTGNEALTLKLTPYGDTVCRMAQFPVAPEE